MSAAALYSKVGTPRTSMFPASDILAVENAKPVWWFAAVEQIFKTYA